MKGNLVCMQGLVSMPSCALVEILDEECFEGHIFFHIRFIFRAKVGLEEPMLVLLGRFVPPLFY